MDFQWFPWNFEINDYRVENLLPLVDAKVAFGTLKRERINTLVDFREAVPWTDTGFHLFSLVLYF